MGNMPMRICYVNVELRSQWKVKQNWESIKAMNKISKCHAQLNPSGDL